MDTEQASPRYADIDLWAPGDVLQAMIEGQMAAVAAVRAALPAIEQAALATEARLRAGGKLIYVGAGTSGRLAVQDGASRDRLQGYIVNLATEREHDLEVMDREAQRCRGLVSQTPSKPARK